MADIKYCFFDIDGVLNTSDMWKRQMYSIDAKLVEKFCKYLDKHQYVPVLTSSWRIGFIESKHPDNSPQIKRLEEMMVEIQDTCIKGKKPECGN